MSTANHRCTSCRKPVHVRGSMCKTCRAVSGTSARDVGIWGGVEWARDDSRRYAVLAEGAVA